MKVYWSLAAIPELADLPPRDRRRLWRETWPKVVWHQPVVLVGFVLIPAVSVGGMYLVGYLALAVGLGWPVSFLLVSGAVGAAYGFIVTQVTIPVVRPYLRAARLAESQSGQQAEPAAPPDRDRM
jgi:hypothetical protein